MSSALMTMTISAWSFSWQQHLQLAVRLKARQHAGGVVVIKQLAAKLQVELVVKLGNALPDVLGLHEKIFIVVKAFFHSLTPLPVSITQC